MTRASRRTRKFVIIDGEGLTMEAHVVNVVRNSFYQLRQLRTVTAAPVCVLIMLEVLVAVVQSI